MNKFEKLVEFIINEDEEKAQELFHEIVVEKSREIYNNLVNEADATDDFVSDIEADEEGSDINFEAEDDDMDDMDDMDMDDMGNEEAEEGDEELEDRVVDLEAALDDLKAEFDAMMADEEGEEHNMDDEEEVEEEIDMFAEEEDEDLDEDEEELEESDDEQEIVREYTEKVAAPKGEDHKADSTVADKNDMGGTASNIAQGGEETGGKAAPAKPMSTGNKNVPGGKQGLEKAPAPKKGE